MASSSTTPDAANNNNTKKRKKIAIQDCPYLDTIHRELLDFDMEPSCCVTLEAGPHVYACLVCGKFFRGRGPQTPAYLHAVDQEHYCFVHLQPITAYQNPMRLSIHPWMISRRHCIPILASLVLRNWMTIQSWLAIGSVVGTYLALLE
jgi:hypothetical protein